MSGWIEDLEGEDLDAIAAQLSGRVIRQGARGAKVGRIVQAPLGRRAEPMLARIKRRVSPRAVSLAGDK